MSLFGTILSALGQFFLAGFLYFFVLATGYRVMETRHLTIKQEDYINWAFIGLTLQPLILSGLMIWWFFRGADSSYYNWHLLPVFSTFLYILYLKYLHITSPLKELGQRWDDIHRLLAEFANVNINNMSDAMLQAEMYQAIEYGFSILRRLQDIEHDPEKLTAIPEIDRQLQGYLAQLNKQEQIIS